MNAETLLSDLVQRDVAVAIHGDQLYLEAPKGVLTEELRIALSEHKPEIMRLLRASSPTAFADVEIDAEGVAAMSLDEFARAGLLVKMRSGVLGRDLLLVSDNVRDSAVVAPKLPVYRAHELRKLAILRPTPRTPRSIQDLKSIFQGVIIDVRSCT